MTHRLRPIGVFGVSLAITLAASSVAFAAPLYGKPVRPLTQPTQVSSSSTASNSDTSSSTTTPNQADPILAYHGNDTEGNGVAMTTADVPEQLKPSQVPACKQHSNVINAIMVRADTRSNNQIAFFTGLAGHVEIFYASSGKTTATYSQLVAAVNTDLTQAQNDLTALLASSTFSCNGNNPSGIVSTYRASLTTEETDIQNLQTAVRNLIQGVAQAVGYTLPGAAEGSQQ